MRNTRPESSDSTRPHSRKSSWTTLGPLTQSVVDSESGAVASQYAQVVLAVDRSHEDETEVPPFQVIQRSMYGRALFFMVLVVAGAVLPYLLADEAWLAKIEELIGPQAANDVVEATEELSPTEIDADSVSVRVTSTESEQYADDQLARSADSTQLAFRPVHRDGTAVKKSDPVNRTAQSGRALELPRIVGPPGASLPHLLSFDISPDWVSRNWARVTTGLSELDLQGWRVPISLAGHGSELVGSITYYFDHDRRVQRILLHGYTPDASEVLQLATTRYAMRRVPSTSEELFAADVAGQPIGGLRVNYSRIMSRDNAGKRCELLMELNRAGSSQGMSREFKRILADAKTQNDVLGRSADELRPTSAGT